MKLDGIATFVAVAEAGSLSEAARRLRLAKSVVSARLAELERSLGASLVRRTTRKLTLTEDGEAFLERALRITREVEDAAAAVAERRGTLSGPLRIAASTTFGHLHLGPALYRFLAQYPGIELALDLDNRRVDAASEGYDAIVRHGPLADSRLVAWPLAPSRRLLVAAPSYLARHGTPASPAALETHRAIFYTNRGVADWRFASPQGPITVRARVALRANNGDVMRDAAIAGLGIALLPTFIAGAAIDEGVLTVIDVGIPAPEEFVFLARPQGLGTSAKLKALVDHLRASFGDPPYWDRAARARGRAPVSALTRP
jgi:DNA-binding transcriptional LysR family regulator